MQNGHLKINTFCELQKFREYQTTVINTNVPGCLGFFTINVHSKMYWTCYWKSQKQHYKSEKVLPVHIRLPQQIDLFNPSR